MMQGKLAPHMPHQVRRVLRAGMLLTGLMYFRRMERTFADVI